MCFLCGVENKNGLNARFFNCEGGVLVGIYEPKDHHRSYPQRMHGGVECTILDEAIGRSVGEDRFAVTTSLEIKFKKPAPVEETVYSISKIVSLGSRMFSGEGTLLNKKGEVLATATATYLFLPAEKISAEEDDVLFFVDEKLPRYIQIGE